MEKEVIAHNQNDAITQSPDLNNQLLHDLFRAYYDARRNKRNTASQLRFELQMEKNIFDLYDEITERRYVLQPSIAFMVFSPVKREVFAADFRDRVIHHLLFNYLNPIMDRRFVFDSYSCRKGKGTHFGVGRIQRAMRSCSDNFTQPFYVMALDVQDYFMSIPRKKVYEKCEEMCKQHFENDQWGLIDYLLKVVIFNDPTQNCIIKGARSDWDGLPPNKSLFGTKKGCGLPIGNLTSQLFSNLYLHDFDCFMKYKLKLKYYGRYVDDFYIIHQDKEYLKEIIGIIRDFLMEELQLKLHPKKIYLQSGDKGVKFLNAFVKPYRTYIRRRTKGKAYQKIHHWNDYFDKRKKRKQPCYRDLQQCRSEINSYLGLMKHHKTYRLRAKLMLENFSPKAFRYFWIDDLSVLRIKKHVRDGMLKAKANR